MGSKEESTTYDTLRYRVIPPIFLIFFTVVTQVLVALGNPSVPFEFGHIFGQLFSLGTPFAWKIVLIFFAWAYVSLIIPSKTFNGPAAPHGYVPVYSANGTQYYLLTLTVFLSYIFLVDDTLCTEIYDNFASIMAVLNLTSLFICVGLIAKALLAPEKELKDPQVSKALDLPLAYQFYRGVELHPRLLGIDIKQWSNCRVGMMGWALLVIVFCVAGIQKNGFHYGPIVNAALINIYLLKFFYWETGYFATLDITLDRAGYYLCWGCLCWVQVFYTFSANFLAGHGCKVSNSEAGVIFIFGLISILLNYISDGQKERFRATHGRCEIWFRPARFLDVEYKDYRGKTKKSRLLLSGFWGMSRHMNYVFEMMLALSWSLPALGHGITPFFYVIFLGLLLFHRTFRDEEKCAAKYGQGWTKYCEAVPYRFVPFVF